MSSNINIFVTLLFAVLFNLFPFPLATSASDFLSPLLSPVIGDLCKEVGCGKGKCKTSDENDFKYECECDPGWKQTAFSNSSGLQFLPCVIPNCTLNYSCSEATTSPKDTPSNASIFEPCHWANCGGGVCNKKSGLAYACECKEGYTNLLNNTAFPCLKECSFGGDCSNLGLTMSNTSTTSAAPPPSLADHSGSNQARSLQQVFFHGVIAVAISIAPSLY